MPFQSAFEEQLKSGEQLSVSLPWRLSIFMMLIFTFSLFIYIGMDFGYRPYLESNVNKLNKDISNLNQSIDESQQKQIMGFYSQLVNIQNLLKTHKMATFQIFDFIEKNTYQNVRFDSLAMSALNGEIKIAGVAPNYETLVKELSLFGQAPNVERLILENSSMSEMTIKGKESIKEIKFEIKLILKK